MPDLRKVHDISLRERKQADPEGYAAATKDAGVSAQTIADDNALNTAF